MTRKKDGYAESYRIPTASGPSSNDASAASGASATSPAAASGGNTGASVTTGVPFSYPPVIPPDEPNMGGLTKQAGYEVAWTGGKPNATWTRLDSSASQFPLTPNQLRSERISDSMKSYNYRKTGLVTLYDAKKDLMSFKSGVKKHLKDTGMDTIAYINDLQSPTKMYHVVDQHNRFLLKLVKDKSLDLKERKFDKYDRLNDEAAIEFLLQSLSPAIKGDIEAKLDDEKNTFVITWLTLIEYVASTSTAKYEKIKNSIKARSPFNYAGQNILDFIRDLEPEVK